VIRGRAGPAYGGRMPEFLVETYAPSGAPGTATRRAKDIALATEQASGPGASVQFLGAVFVPEEETCFFLYRAPSVAAVRAAVIRARLRPQRITPAVSIRPPASGADLADTSSCPLPHTSPPPAFGTGPPAS